MILVYHYLSWYVIHRMTVKSNVEIWSLKKSILFSDLPKMSGRVAIVTGGARGIGAEIVRILLECDMEVIVGKYFCTK